MGCVVEILIKENTELMETKNALNIVKNDLISRLDELSSEQEILREEIRSLEMVRTKMAEKIREQEEELKAAREKLEEFEKNRDEEVRINMNDDKQSSMQDDVPVAQRKRFTRVEMA